MKKGFKRFLSATLATVMAVAGMTIGMATSAMAANHEYGSVAQTSSQVKEWGFTTNMPSGSNVNLAAGDTVNDITFVTVPKANLNKSSYLSATTGTVFNVPVPANSTGTIYVKATSGSTTRYVSFKDGTEEKQLIMNTSTTNNSATFTASATADGYIQLTAAGGECKIGLIQITLDAGFSFGEVTTYNWNLDLTGLTNVDGTGLSLGNATTTALSNTLSYTGTGFTLKDTYATITDATAGVTVDSANNTVTVKPTDDWFDVVAPRNYVSVEPSENGNMVTYNFIQDDNTEKYLVSVNDATKSSTTAYTAFSVDGTSDNDCYVTLDTTGAKLCDDSATAAVKLMIPYSASTGKVTVSGRVTPTNNIGGKWKLVDLGCVSVATDDKKMVTLTDNNQVTSTDNVGVAVKNQPIDYVVTIDFAAKTASGTITNGATSKEFTNVPFEAGTTNMGAIAFTTNNGNSISAGNDRGLLVPYVTITAEESTSPVVTTTDANSKPGVITVGDANYVVSVVSSEDAKTASSLVQKTAAGDEIASTDTVYKQIVLDGNTYTAKDINPNAGENDYVFASIVNNDNATEQVTVITNIQKLVSEVK